jgi:hypothetical protein
MLARYAGAFGMSMAMHAAIVAALVWTTYVPPPAFQAKPDKGVEVVLLPPSEDSQFPGLKPVERSRAGAPLEDLKSEGQIAGADIDRIGGHLFVLFPFVNPGLRSTRSSQAFPRRRVSSSRTRTPAGVPIASRRKAAGST